jgi:hypothetical protein
MEILRGRRYNSDNLHRIAISNLSSSERRIERWWESKYRTPMKQYDEHTYEELVIKMLEDYYDKNPAEMERFKATDYHGSVEEWDGKVSEEYESAVQKTLEGFFNKNKVDLSKYQDDEAEIKDLSDEDILENLRKTFPSRPTPKRLGEGEFEEDFED